MTGMTLADAADHIARNDPRFAVEDAVIGGVRFRTFKNAPGNLRELLRVGQSAHDDGDFVVYRDERWSYAAFIRDTNRLAAALAGDLGVRPGDRIALAMRNYPELLLLMMAVASLGAVVVFVNAWWTAEELEYALGDSETRLVFADGPRYERIAGFAAARGIRLVGVRDGEDGAALTFSGLMGQRADASWPDVAIEPDADFAVMYSSGSTGHPKGVVLTHRGAISAVYSWLMSGEIAKLLEDASLGVAGGDAPKPPVVLIVTPLFHVTATHPLWLHSIPLGARNVLLRKWDAEEAVRVIQREQVSRFIGVPTQSADLMLAAKRLGAEMPSLEYIGSGGAKRPPPQVAELADAFPNRVIASGWGMTETNALGLGLSGPDYLDRPGAAGRLLPPLQEMKIADDDGNAVPNGTVGELVVKSPANMRCYLNDPEATAEVLRDGWLYTGDLASLDDDGFVTIVDRKKNIIIRGGENIACLDVEAAIHRHAAVIEAGVFPVPDARLGEAVGAGVQLHNGTELSPHELRNFLAEHIAPFKIPEHIWFLDRPLPRGATDKLDRRRLRADCLAAAIDPQRMKETNA